MCPGAQQILQSGLFAQPILPVSQQTLQSPQTMQGTFHDSRFQIGIDSGVRTGFRMWGVDVWRVRTKFLRIRCKLSPELWSGPVQSPDRIRSNHPDSARDSPVSSSGFCRHINMQTSPKAQQKLPMDRGNPIRSGPPKLRTPACSTAQLSLNCRKNLQKIMSGGGVSPARDKKSVCIFTCKQIASNN